MGNLKLTRWDASEYLETEDDIDRYLELAFEDDSVEHIDLAITTAAKARAMTQISEKLGIDRKALYKTLSERDIPDLSKIKKSMYIALTSKKREFA